MPFGQTTPSISLTVLQSAVKQPFEALWFELGMLRRPCTELGSVGGHPYCIRLDGLSRPLEVDPLRGRRPEGVEMG